MNWIKVEEAFNRYAALYKEIMESDSVEEEDENDVQEEPEEES